MIETGGRAEVPYDQVVEELGRAGIAVPEIRAVFGMTEQPPPLAFAGLELMPLKPVFPVMPWQFSFMVDRWYEADGCAAAFDARIHDPSGVRGFVERYPDLLRSACAHPDRPLAELHVTRR